jgi:hypothetical protein
MTTMLQPMVPIKPGEIDMMLQKFPRRVPIYVRRSTFSENKRLPDIPRKKLLFPDDLMFGQLVYCIRKQLRLAPEQGLYLFINNHIPSSHANLQQIYQTHRAADGLLHVTYDTENTFG